MGYDPTRRIYTPDFNPPEQQGWLDMPDDAPIDAGPAAAAFKQRFMGGGPAQPDAHAPMAHPADMGMGPMGHEGMGGAMGAHGNAMDAPAQMKPKSL